MLEIVNLNREGGYFGLVLEISIHDQWTHCFCACGEATHQGQSPTSWMVTKEWEKGAESIFKILCFVFLQHSDY
jgi:hypothetical protein